ncbi:MAG: beta-ketoacyl-ACP synthase III [Bacteroidota bacterium]
MLRSKIAGLGYYVPENVVTNDDLAKLMDTSDEWIRERSGIQERRYFTEGKDTVAGMGVKAAKIALERANLTADDIDLIIFATLNPDYMFPGSGVLVQRELGLHEKGVPALDIRNQCSGFVYGLSIADQFIRTGMYKNVLMVGGEIHSSGLDFSDRGRAVTVLFGDGAGAAVLSATETEEEKGVLVTKLHADGEHAEMLAVLAPTGHKKRHITHEMIDDGSVYPVMNGRMVFKMAVQKFPEVIMEALNATGYKPEDVNMFIPHQANLRIAEAVRKTMGWSEDQVHNNIMKYGNTTAASIPIALTEAWELGKIKEGDLVCLAAFGSGFTWASALIRW